MVNDETREVTKERLLRAEPRIIAWGGPDGSGKDTVLRLVMDQVDQTKVAIADIGHFNEGGVGQRSMQDKIDQRGGHPIRYGLAFALAWREVVPELLGEGKIVIVKRPFNFLTHVVTNNQEETNIYLRKQIRNGRITNGLWPGAFVEFVVSPTDAWKNLESRGKLTESDPHSEEECSRRIQAEQEVFEFVKELPKVGNTTVFPIFNPRIDDAVERDAALHRISNGIMKNLALPLRADLE